MTMTPDGKMAVAWTPDEKAVWDRAWLEGWRCATDKELERLFCAGPSESAIRRKAQRRGFYVSKSRKRRSINQRGGYQLTYGSFIVAGHHWELDLETISEILGS